MSRAHDDDGRTDDDDHSGAGSRTVEERRERPADGRRTEWPPWPDDVEKGDELRLTYDRRGEIPDHWERVQTYTVVVTGEPMKAAGMPTLTVEGPYAMHADGEVSIHADGGLYHRSHEPGRWSVQIGRHATVRTEPEGERSG